MLANELAVIRGTVVAAYQELRDAGLIESRRGSGTRVAPPAAANALTCARWSARWASNQLMRRYMDERPDDVIDMALGA